MVICGAPSEPGEAVEDRVAAGRAEVPDCTSDPSEDRPTTLGGAYGVEWTWSCGASYHAAVNAIHDGRRHRLEVSVPTGSEALAVPLLEQLRQSFAFTSAEAPSGGAEADLAALVAELQGTWVSAWHARELEIATIEAAGQTAPSDWVLAIKTATTSRYGVKFEDGIITQYGAADGGPLGVGWVGTYRLLDDHTIEAIETGSFWRIVYEFTLRDEILTMDVVSDEDPVDMAIQTAIYETLPSPRCPDPALRGPRAKTGHHPGRWWPVSPCSDGSRSPALRLRCREHRKTAYPDPRGLTCADKRQARQGSLRGIGLLSTSRGRVLA